MKSILVKCLIVCTIILVLPSVVISFIFALDTILTHSPILPGPCDYTLNLGLGSQISQFILALGIICIITCIALIICYILVLCRPATSIGIVGIMVISMLNGIFGVEWLFVGIKLLFVSNKNCIRNGIIHIITGLLLWCVAAINIFKERCEAKKNQI